MFSYPKVDLKSFLVLNVDGERMAEGSLKASLEGTTKPGVRKTFLVGGSRIDIVFKSLKDDLRNGYDSKNEQAIDVGHGVEEHHHMTAPAASLLTLTTTPSSASFST